MEEVFKQNLGSTKGDIKRWLTCWFRKNSKHPATIKLRCSFGADQPCFWRYFIELSVNGKLKYQNEILKEVWDTFDLDKTYQRDHYTGIDFIIIKTK